MARGLLRLICLVLGRRDQRGSGGAAEDARGGQTKDYKPKPPRLLSPSRSARWKPNIQATTCAPLGNEKLPAQTQSSPDVLIKRAGGNILSPNTLQENALLLEKAQWCVLIP